MKKNVTISKRLRYEFDKLFSRGPSILVLFLAAGSFAIILLWSILLVITRQSPGQEPPMNFLEAFWFSLLGTMGQGSVGGRESNWGFRLLTFAIALSSIFVISNFIGLVANAIQKKFSELRKGKTEVLESGHTIILGWSSQVFAILKEIIAANEDVPKSSLVILSPEDKSQMEDMIRQKIGPTRKTTILCRNGNPMEMDDLELASLQTSKSIIIPSPNHPLADAEVIKTVLAITKSPTRRFEPYHIVAGIRLPENRKITEVVGRGEVEWIQVSDVISRIIAQTCRQMGLSVVYTELLGFTRNEIYFTDVRQLSGISFGRSLHAFENCAVVGLVDQLNGPRLNPPKDTILMEGDQLIIISADDHQVTCDVDSQFLVDSSLILMVSKQEPIRERILILGWNWNAINIIQQLDYYVDPGSSVLVVTNSELAEKSIQKHNRLLRNLKVDHRHGDTSDRDTLVKLKLKKVDHIILLSYSDEIPVQEADSLSLMTLLHLRDLAEQKGYTYSIVSEILDERNSRLAEVTRADDFIVSDRLISLMMAQVEQNKKLNGVFKDLFSPEGSEIYLKPASSYVYTGIPINFHTVIEAAAARNEIAFGYRLVDQANDPVNNYGVVINPAKSEKVLFSKNDKIIVMAES